MKSNHQDFVSRFEEIKEITTTPFAKISLVRSK
jgi:hypothetical protein